MNLFALVLLGGCNADFRGLRVRPLDAVGNVIEVTWRREEDEVGWVEYGDGFALSAPELRGADEHRVLLLGLPQLTEVTLRPVIQRGGERVPGPERSEESRTLPPDLPEFQLSVYEPEQDAGGYVLASTVGNPRSVVILNRQGEIVWYHVPEEPLVAVDPELNHHGPGLLLNLTTAERDLDIGVLRSVGMDGEITRDLRLPLAHHVFEQLGGDRYAYLAMDLSEGPEGQPVVGDALTLIDGLGNSEVLWSSWDTFTWDGVEEAQEDFYPQGYDFTHGNGLFYDAEAGTLLYSTRNLSTLVELDAQSGEVVRMIGEQGGTTFSPSDAAFSHQHCPTRTADGTLLVFDNGEPSKPGHPVTSVVREYEEGEGSLTELDRLPLRQNLSVAVLGCAERIDGGHTLSDWGSAGELVEFDADGEIVWQLSGRAGVVLGNTTWIPDLYALEDTVPIP